MKYLLLLTLVLAPFYLLSQGMNVKWEDSDGREFTINTHSRNFSWSMIAGDNVSYNNSYSGGPDGTVRAIGPIRVSYNNSYSGGPDGSVKSVGDVRITYHNSYSGGPDGAIKSVGGLKIYYNNLYSGGPEGSIKRTEGSVN